MLERYDQGLPHSHLNAMVYDPQVVNLQRLAEKSLHVINDGRYTIKPSHHRVVLLGGHPTICHTMFLLVGFRLPCRLTPLDWVILSLKSIIATISHKSNLSFLLI